MNWKADRSLRWNLIRRLLALQAAMQGDGVRVDRLWLVLDGLSFNPGV